MSLEEMGGFASQDHFHVSNFDLSLLTKWLKLMQAIDEIILGNSLVVKEMKKLIEMVSTSH